MTVINIIRGKKDDGSYLGKIEIYLGYGITKDLCLNLRKKGFKYNKYNKQYYRFYSEEGKTVAYNHLKDMMCDIPKYVVRRMNLKEVIKNEI